MVVLMKRLVWVSILLTLAGLFLPLVFMSGATGYDGDSVLDSPAIETSPSPAPAAETQQVSYGRDSEFYFGLSVGGEVKSVSMAQYLPCAVAAEMPVTFEPEALKAQAVAARTYVVYCTLHQNPKHPEADVCEEYSCCLAYLDETVLRGNWGEKYEENMALISEACTSTDGQILTYEDSAILATFHSSSSGQTQAGAELWADVPYLTNVTSPETADNVPNYLSTVEVSPDNFKSSIHLLYPETSFESDPVLWVDSFELDDSGRVRYMTICGTTLTGSEMRKLFSLRSAAFTLDYDGSAFIFSVTGYGHGLGMSQYGANVMAQNGSTYKEILEHYYPSTKLE